METIFRGRHNTIILTDNPSRVIRGRPIGSKKFHILR